jgi:hypothetical protein
MDMGKALITDKPELSRAGELEDDDIHIGNVVCHEEGSSLLGYMLKAANAHTVQQLRHESDGDFKP